MRRAPRSGFAGTGWRRYGLVLPIAALWSEDPLRAGFDRASRATDEGRTTWTPADVRSWHRRRDLAVAEGGRPVRGPPARRVDAAARRDGGARGRARRLAARPGGNLDARRNRAWVDAGVGDAETPLTVFLRFFLPATESLSNRTKRRERYSPGSADGA